MRWLFAQGDGLGVDPRRMAVGGDSAGGTLAAVCALIARDAGLPLSLQLVAPNHREDLCLRAARAYEQVTPWGAMRPKVGSRGP